MQPAAAGVLVTGATGFVGRHIVIALLAQGYTVTALIRPENFGGQQQAGQQRPDPQTIDPRLPDGCIQIPVAITDVEGLVPVVAACDAVIYAAGSVRGGSLQDFQTANKTGLEAVVTAMDRAGAKLPILLISSLAASCPELSDYALSKFNGERCLVINADMPWTIFRPPAIYGPGDKEMLPILKMAAKGWLFIPGPVDQRVALLHVEDLARAAMAWLNSPAACLHQTYAFDDGTPGGYDWPAMAEAVGAKKYRMVRLPGVLLAGAAQLNLLFSRLLSHAPMFTPGKVRELSRESWLCGDNARFEQATGWRPELNLQAGWEYLNSTPHSASKSTPNSTKSG